MMNRIAVKLYPAAEKKIKQGHPWIFDGGIKKINKEPQQGDLAILFDTTSNRFLACGLIDIHSPIRIKVIHVGKPVEINPEFFAQKIRTAYQKREKYIDKKNNGYRLIYGESDGLPGLIIDIFGHCGVIKLYSSIWKKHLDGIIATTVELTTIKSLVLRVSRQVESENDPLLHNGKILYGTLENENILFKEKGVSFYANVLKGHKTGFFLDHRANRYQIQHLAHNKKVLDVFCYSGGFTVHALLGGAKHVTSIDISKHALEVLQTNASLNGTFTNHTAIAQDAFLALQQLIDQNNTFELVIIDPPSFAKNKKEIEQALHAYQRLAKLAVSLVEDGGILMMASCSARVLPVDFFSSIESVFKDRFLRLHTSLHDFDHPIIHPESAYLKTAYYQKK